MICLALHTPEHAAILKDILENHGVRVKIEAYYASDGPLKVADKIMIEEENLPLALKLTESGDNFAALKTAMEMAGMSNQLLIPVDFSESSMLAVSVGFSIAGKLKARPMVIHSFVSSMIAQNAMPMADPLDLSDNMEQEQEEMVVAGDIRKQAEIRLRAFKKKIKDAQNAGKMPDIPFKTELLDGVAEETIVEWCRVHRPVMVVMATRGIHKKEEDLIGSVTAEVLDSCRVPVLTVPDNLNYKSIDESRRLMMFCNLDQHDLITIDSLMRMFSYPTYEVALVPVPYRRNSGMRAKIDSLCKFLNENYPTSKFFVRIPDDKNFREAVDKICHEDKIDFIIVPNKKTNIFSRIFHPTIAHKFLFERDMPMLAIPV